MCLFAVATRCEFRRVSICSNIFFFSPAPIEIRTFQTPVSASQPTEKWFVIFVKKLTRMSYALLTHSSMTLDNPRFWGFFSRVRLARGLLTMV